MNRFVGSVMAGILVIGPVGVVFGAGDSSPSTETAPGVGDIKGEQKALKGSRRLHKGEYKEDKRGDHKRGYLKSGEGKVFEYKEGTKVWAPQKGEVKIETPTK